MPTTRSYQRRKREQTEERRESLGPREKGLWEGREMSLAQDAFHHLHIIPHVRIYGYRWISCLCVKGVARQQFQQILAEHADLLSEVADSTPHRQISHSPAWIAHKPHASALPEHTPQLLGEDRGDLHHH